MEGPGGEAYPGPTDPNARHLYHGSDALLEFQADPIAFKRYMWPHVRFYKKQVLVVESVRDVPETYCFAAHQMGKDFVAGFIVHWFFLCHPVVRVVTTSVKDDHLRVLWGEIGRYTNTCAWPLRAKDGGPLVTKHREMNKLLPAPPGADPVKGRTLCTISYALGMVSERGEGLAGHHAPHTLLVVDEACYDSETEVLTREGWKLFSLMSDSDEVLTADPKTMVATYQKPTRLQRIKYTGPMYLYERRGGNFCVTPNHNMLWSRRQNPSRNVTTWSNYHLERMDRIDGVERRIPRQFKWVGTDPGTYTIPKACYGAKTYAHVRVPIKEWLEFLGWWCSEGSLIYQNNRPVAALISQNDEKMLHRLASVISGWGMRPKVYGGHAPCLRIHDTRLAHHLSECGRYCWEKRVPAYVGDMTPELIEIFLRAYTDGDGTRRSGGRDIIYTSSPPMADDLQVLSYKAGRMCTVMKRDMVDLKAPNGYARHDGYMVARSRPGLASHLKIKKNHLQVIDYDGWVYCATVPDHHTLFVRRKGVCMWCGNSGVDEEVLRATSWARRLLVLGNPYGPVTSWFAKACEGGDVYM